MSNYQHDVIRFIIYNVGNEHSVENSAGIKRKTTMRRIRRGALAMPAVPVHNNGNNNKIIAKI